MEQRFTVPGDPVPHASVTYRSKFMPENRRAKRAANYKESVRVFARKARIRLPIPIKEKPVTVVTQIYFRNGRHGDPESVHKVIKDALWPARNGGDKYTGGSYSAPLYDAQSPRVEVTIIENEGSN